MELESIEKRLQDGEDRMNSLESDLQENTRLTESVKSDTAELIEAFKSIKGAFKVLEMLASLAKPLSYILMFCTAVAGFWYAIKGGTK